MKISSCLILHDNEKIIKRCLESIKDISDEIIVVHDGNCHDRTLDICKEFNCNIFIRPFHGEAEHHRPFSYSEALNDWILQLDADEFIDKDTRKKIPHLIKSGKFDGFAFLWCLWDGKRYFTKKSPYKICLFNKKKISYLGIAHEGPRLKNYFKTKLQVHHKPAYNHYTLRAIFTKHNKIAKIQAMEILSDFKKIPKYNYPENDFPIHFILNRIFPFLSIIWDLPIAFLRSIKIHYKDHINLFRPLLLNLGYSFLLHYYLIRFKYFKK